MIITKTLSKLEYLKPENYFINKLYWKGSHCGQLNHPLFTTCKVCLRPNFQVK